MVQTCFICGARDDRRCGCWRDRLVLKIETEEWIFEEWVLV